MGAQLLAVVGSLSGVGIRLGAQVNCSDMCDPVGVRPWRHVWECACAPELCLGSVPHVGVVSGISERLRARVQLCVNGS